MRKFSNFLESMSTADINPGNALANTGVSNHYTPIENIVLNVKNIFGCRKSIVVAVGEDSVSLKMHSSRFTSEKAVYDLLSEGDDTRNISLIAYIQQQGLPIVKLVQIGDYYIVYFCPDDIKIAQEPVSNPVGECKEMKTMGLDEAEMCNPFMDHIFEDDEELEDITRKKIHELVKSKDKVKSAKQLELIVGQSMELPKDYYFAGIKLDDGEEAIGLRWKYMKNRPHGKTAELKKTLVYIFDIGDDAIYVSDFDKESMFKYPDEVETLIKNFLDILGAEETDDPCIYSLGSESSKKKKDDEDSKDDKDKKDDEKEPKNKKDDEDTEDDKSRGDSSDNVI